MALWEKKFPPRAPLGAIFLPECFMNISPDPRQYTKVQKWKKFWFHRESNPVPPAWKSSALPITPCLLNGCCGLLRSTYESSESKKRTKWRNFSRRENLSPRDSLAERLWDEPLGFCVSAMCLISSFRCSYLSINWWNHISMPIF